MSEIPLLVAAYRDRERIEQKHSHSRIIIEIVRRFFQISGDDLVKLNGNLFFVEGCLKARAGRENTQRNQFSQR